MQLRPIELNSVFNLNNKGKDAFRILIRCFEQTFLKLRNFNGWKSSNLNYLIFEQKREKNQ